MNEPASTPWQRGRFDGRRGPQRVLFGRMYEDAAIERTAFRPGGRIFCIASAGCTAMQLAAQHEVVAVDINPRQLAYAARRIEGAPAVRGTAEHVMAMGRRFAPLMGWTKGRVRAFLDLEDPAEQIAYWRRHLDTRRFRLAFDALFSVVALRRVYAAQFLAFLPRRLGAVMRSRMERCFALHANRSNPHARALLLGELAPSPAIPSIGRIELVAGDAAALLEQQPAGSFDGFALSNILDGADAAYRLRLAAAVRHAARAGAKVVMRSFAEPSTADVDNRAAEDRAMLWGVVVVRPAASMI